MLQYNELYIKHITGERGSMLNFIRGFCMALADSVMKEAGCGNRLTTGKSPV